MCACWSCLQVGAKRKFIPGFTIHMYTDSTHTMLTNCYDTGPWLRRIFCWLFTSMLVCCHNLGKFAYESTTKIIKNVLGKFGEPCNLLGMHTLITRVCYPCHQPVQLDSATSKPLSESQPKVNRLISPKPEGHRSNLYRTQMFQLPPIGNLLVIIYWEITWTLL